MDDDLVKRISALEDVAHIRDLRDQYHHFVNERQCDRFREIYIAGGTTRLDDTLYWQGVDQIVEGFRDMFSRVPFLLQFGHNQQITLNAGEASAVSYLDARYGAGSESLVVAARYDETYVRTSAGWRIRDTVCKILFAVPPDAGWAGEKSNHFRSGRP